MTGRGGGLFKMGSSFIYITVLCMRITNYYYNQYNVYYNTTVYTIQRNVSYNIMMYNAINIINNII